MNLCRVLSYHWEKLWQRACVCKYILSVVTWKNDNWKMVNTILKLAFRIIFGDKCVWLSFALWWSLNPKIRISNKFLPVIVNLNFWCQRFVFEYIANRRFSEGHDDLTEVLTSLFQKISFLISLKVKTYPRVCLIYLINILMSIFDAQCHQK